MNQKRIVFLGTPEMSATFLEGLVNAGFNVVGVVTKEDKIRDRNHKLEPSPVAEMAEKLSLPV
ncbi:MAG: methionyl-tRNA formyltransferase, partial [Bacilli bacterium]